MHLRGCIFYDNSKSKILHKLAYLVNDMHKKYVDTREIKNHFIGLKEVDSSEKVHYGTL